MPRTVRKSLHTGCALLFGLPFFAVGVFMTGWLVRDVYRSIASQSWEEVPAEILTTNLSRSSGSEGGSSYCAEATYTYQFNGRDYQGDRVSWDTSHDNIGSWQRTTHKQLEAARKQNRPLPCWVNPENPHDALLFRGLRPEMMIFKTIFGLVFGAVGGGVMFGGWIGQRRKARLKKAQEENPETPWRAIPGWQTNNIPDKSGKSFLPLLLFAMVWNLISWGITYPFFFSEPELPPFGLPWLILLFPMVGLLLAFWAARFWLRHRPWAGSFFQAEQLPLAPGDTLRGSFHFVRRPPDMDLEARVLCTRTTHSGKHHHESTLCERRHTLRGSPVPGPDGTRRLSLRMPLPGGRDTPLASIPDDDTPSVTWMLQLHESNSDATTPLAAFPLPVVRPATDSPIDTESTDTDLPTDSFGLPDKNQALLRSRISRERARNGQGIVYKTGNKGRLGSTLGALLFFSIFLGVGIAIMAKGPLFFGLIWSTITVGISGLIMVTALRRTRITVDRGTVELDWRYGPVRRTQSVDARAVTDVATETWMTVNGRKYYQLAITHDSGTAKVLGGIPDREAADAMAEHLMEDIRATRK